MGSYTPTKPRFSVAQAKTAKEGAALLGKIVETQGAGESFGVGFVDNLKVVFRALKFVVVEEF